MEPGATCPRIYASDNKLKISYCLADENPLTRRLAVEFSHILCHYFGWPNDEVLNGHPLHKRGLGFYGVFEVLDSSWIRSLEAGNSLHDRHNPAGFVKARHFVFTFHDNTFECIAEGISFAVTDVIDASSDGFSE
jgi:hypothetical protein